MENEDYTKWEYIAKVGNIFIIRLHSSKWSIWPTNTLPHGLGIGTAALNFAMFIFKSIQMHISCSDAPNLMCSIYSLDSLLWPHFIFHWPLNAYQFAKQDAFAARNCIQSGDQSMYRAILIGLSLIVTDIQWFKVYINVVYHVFTVYIQWRHDTPHYAGTLL